MDFLTWGYLIVAVALFFYVLALIMSTPYFFYFYFDLREKKAQRNDNKGANTRFAVLIPARYEGSAIKPLLESLRDNPYPKELLDVYVITETRADPVFALAQEYGFSSLARQDNTLGVKTKGGALDDAYRQLCKRGKEYDSFAIFDADNIVSRDFFVEMDKLRAQGYKVCLGLRDFTNRTDNWISATSALMLTLTANFSTAGRKHLADKGFVTGTGYCIDSSLIAEFGRWPFQGLTEDMEINDFCLHRPDVRMGFTRFAPFYDEQPTDLSTMHKQHLRWMFGYFTIMGEKFPKTTKIKNFLVAWEANLWGLFYIINLVVSYLAWMALLGLAIASIFVSFNPWLFVMFAAMFLFWIWEFDSVGLFLSLADLTKKPSLWIRTKTVLLFFIYMLDYAFGFLEGLLFPHTWKTWTKIKHKAKE